jgi:hypothetical protein
MAAVFAFAKRSTNVLGDSLANGVSSIFGASALKLILSLLSSSFRYGELLAKTMDCIMMSQVINK